MLARMLKHALN